MKYSMCDENLKEPWVGSNWTHFDFLVEVAVRIAEGKLDQEISPQIKGREERKKRVWGFKYFSHIVVPKEEEVSLKQEKRKLKWKRQSEEEEEEEGKEELKLKLKRSKKDQPVCPNPTPFLPGNFQRLFLENGGSNLALVIQKPLFQSDVNPDASRFSIPFSQIQTGFLTEKETKDLARKIPMDVCLIEPSTKETFLTLNRWNMQKSSMYVLTTQWNSVVADNGLKIGDIVQLWSFRVGSNLCFVLVKLPTYNKNN